MKRAQRLALTSFSAVLLAVASGSVCAADQAHIATHAQVQDVLARNSYDIYLRGGRIGGAGGDLLLRLGADAEFLAIGEEHNNADIPPLVTALFRQLHQRAGYNYLAEEQDAVITRLISEPPMRGNLAAIDTQAISEKHSFTFNSDEELRMIADIGSISTGKGRPIWGCEQVFGGTHVLERIVEKAPSPAARALASDLLQDARNREATRDGRFANRFMIDPAVASKMAELQRLYAPVADPETRFLVNSLGQSVQIYHFYWNGDHDRSPGYFSNSAVREEHMKQLCRDEYQRSAALDGRPPRAILKFGDWHLYQAYAPSSVPTLGTFMSDIARMNGLGFVSVRMMVRQRNGKPVWTWDDDHRAYAAFAPVLQRSGWVLVDLRPLREYPVYRALLASAGADLSQDAKDNLRRLVFGFDFALFLDDNREGHFTLGQMNPNPQSAAAEPSTSNRKGR